MTIDEQIKKQKDIAHIYAMGEGLGEYVEEHIQIAEWLEELKAMRNLDKTNYSDGYEKGRADAIVEFKQRLLEICDCGSEQIDCTGGQCDKCDYNSVDYSSIVDLAEELKEENNEM